MPAAKVAIVIPARHGSTRFPGKPLFPIAGKPLIQHVWERCGKARGITAVIVATDDMRIAEAAFEFGAEVAMTSPKHRSGTDRCAEVAKRLRGFSHVINVQGDEPLISPEVLSRLVHDMRRTGCEMGTAAVPFALTDRDPDDPNAVKVVVDEENRALYFSRSRIPYCRAGGSEVKPLLHWGLYAYRRDFLASFVTWPRGRLEQCEMLEQLRALEHGARILVLQAEHQSFGVDVPEDVALVERLLAQAGGE